MVTEPKILRFDTITWNPQTAILEVWRYADGIYPGTHEVILSTSTWGLVKDEVDLLMFASIIGIFFSLSITGTEHYLPRPWFGYRFI